MKLHFSRHLTLTLTAFFAMLFVPHAYLATYDLYTPKLRVNSEIGGEFVLGLAFAGLFTLVLLLSLSLAGTHRVAVRQRLLDIEQRRSFRYAMGGLTILMFLLLLAGIGAKQSTSSLNFVIRLLPRDMVIIIAAVAAVATRRWFWIALGGANVAYWILVGSKAPLFLVALTLLFFWVFERGRIRIGYLFWGAVLALLLPLSFMTAMALRLGIAPLAFLRMLLASPDNALFFVGNILARVSWFDGMQLTAFDATPLRKFATMDFIEIAVARLLPGVNSSLDPFGQQVIYLYNAVNLDDFSGAIGMPGVLKVFYYNHGIIGVIALMLLVSAYFFLLGKMMESRKPITAITGYSVFIVSLSSLAISGNVDSAFGKSIPILITGLALQHLTRAVFVKPGMRARPR